MCTKYNNLYCRPPLDIDEFERMWTDAVVHVADQEMEKEDGAGAVLTEPISVAEAIRRSNGKVVVKGIIIGFSSVIQVVTQTEFECSKCGKSDSVLHNPPLFSLPYYLSSVNKSRCCDS